MCEFFPFSVKKIRKLKSFLGNYRNISLTQTFAKTVIPSVTKMNVLYLFFLSFVFSSNIHIVSGFVSGFVSHLPHTHYRISSQTQLLSKTCFADDDDRVNSNPNQNILPNLRTQYDRVGMRNIVKSPMYIVIWKDCKECKELIHNMELLNVKYFYFNVDTVMSDYLEPMDFHGEDAEDHRRIMERQNLEKRVWKNLKDVQNRIEIPIFYKDDVYLGNQLMDIYCELYPM